MGRCPPGGTSAASCRWVKRSTMSHGKRQGQGHGKHGPPYLEWASREAAPCALRCSPTGQRFSPRQQANSPVLGARQAVAHTRARACYDSMRDLLPCEVHPACGCGRACGGVEGGDGEAIGGTTRRVMRPDLNP
jgi:hypothetical protein